MMTWESMWTRWVLWVDGIWVKVSGWANPKLAWLKEYAYQVFIGEDQRLNAWLGGSADETFSSRCYRTRFIPLFNRLRIVVDFIFYPLQGPAHCMHAYQKEVLGRQLPYRFFDEAHAMNLRMDESKLGPNIEMPK